MAQDITLTADGLFLNWLKEVGDEVKAGEVIAEVEADKATLEIEAPANGVLIETRAELGTEYAEGDVIGVIGEAGEAPSNGTAPKKAEESAPAEPEPEQKSAPAEPEQKSAPAPATATTTSVTEAGRIKASPLARNMAQDQGIPLNQVQGTGPNGRIVKKDIENYQPPTAEAAMQKVVAGLGGLDALTFPPIPKGDDVEIIDVPRIRRIIAKNTLKSKQEIPHFYVTTEIMLDDLLRLRKVVNAELARFDVKVSVNDLVVKAAAIALLKYPNLNSHFYGDKIVRYKRINIGIAVALPNGGLMNVVAKDVDRINLSTLAQNNKEMIARAREGKVKPEDIRGSTFTVSNLGPFDVENFAAIINPPEAAILAVSSGKKVPVVLEGDTLGVATSFKITISVDHRVSDGAEGAEYLQHLKEIIENPMRLLV